MRKITSISNKIYLIETVETDITNADCVFGKSLHLTTENQFYISEPIRVIKNKDILLNEPSNSMEIDFFHHVSKQPSKEIPKTKKILEEYELEQYF
ncbi:MAG: hypothetical protein LBE23_09805 [Vagococcus sp.]|jgi:hypothetical protein|nr:hypothetical protein [Vagococcus sp.]